MHEIDASRERFLEAFSLARGLGAAELLARAACGFGKWHRYGKTDRVAISLLEEALAALAGGVLSVRARTLGILAARLDPGESQERRESLFTEALGIARGLEETETMRALLRTAPDVVCRPESAELRLTLAGEALAEQRRDDNPERVAWMRMNHFLALLELGRLTEADEALAAYSALAANLRQPWFDWHLTTVRATRAAVDGRLDDATKLSLAARDLELEADPDAVETWAAQSFMIGRERGDFSSADEETLRRCVARHPERPLWRALLARLCCGTGRAGEAAREFELCGVGSLPLDLEWMATVTMLVETADVLGEEVAASELRRSLEPYAERTAVVDRAWAAWGPVSDFLQVTDATSAGS
jgi:hypothetical protein